MRPDNYYANMRLKCPRCREENIARFVKRDTDPFTYVCKKCEAVFHAVRCPECKGINYKRIGFVTFNQKAVFTCDFCKHEQHLQVEQKTKKTEEAKETKHITQRINSTRIVVSFKSENQIPYLMIVKEYYCDGVIVHAKVLYKEDSKESEFCIDKSAQILDSLTLIERKE